MRCTHGSREVICPMRCHRKIFTHRCPQCSWPEGVPARKKSVARRDEVDGRPSTAGSSGVSDASTPPARDLTPPRLNLTQVPSRAPRYIPSNFRNKENATNASLSARALSRCIPLAPNMIQVAVNCKSQFLMTHVNLNF